MKLSIFIPYLLVMALVTYLIRAVPFLLMRKKIENPVLNAFFEYIPYAVLTAMTIPAIFYATEHTPASAMGFAAAFICAYKRRSLIVVAIAACLGAAVGEAAISLFLH